MCNFLNKKIVFFISLRFYWENAVRLTAECAQKFGYNFFEFGVRCIGGNLLEERLLISFDMLQEFHFEFGDFRWIHFVQVATDTAENNGNLDANGN